MAYTFKIISDTTGAVNGIKKVQNQMQGLHSDVNKATNSISTLEKHLRRVGEYMVMRFAVHGLFEMGKGILDTTAKFEALTNVIKYSSTDTKDAGENIKFVTDLVKRLHLPLQETYEGFANMQAGMVGTGIQGEKMRKIFEALSTANSVLHLNPNTMGRIFYDVKVMAEMTNVQKRELGRMLARVLPGTMKIAANASDTDIEGFLAKMKAGLVKSKDFLPKFAEGIQKYYVEGLRNSTKSVVANMNDVKTAMTLIELQLGNRLKPMLIEIMQTIVRVGQKFVDWLGTKEGEAFYQTIYDIWNSLKWLVKTLWDLRGVLKVCFEIWLAWKTLDFFGGMIIGGIKFVNVLTDIATGASSVSLAMGAWVLPLAATIALLYVSYNALRDFLDLGNNKELYTKRDRASLEAAKAFNKVAKAGMDDNDLAKYITSGKASKKELFDYNDYRNKQKETDRLEDIIKGRATSHNLSDVWTNFKKDRDQFLGLTRVPKQGDPDYINHGNLDGKGEGGTNTDAAMNASNLSGANGGLGQAKVLNLYFNKALIENNIPGGDGKDLIAKSQQAAELLIRICNNIASPQGAIM